MVISYSFLWHGHESMKHMEVSMSDELEVMHFIQKLMQK